METAIVGIAFRFPGAKDAETFWANLAQRKSNVTEVPAERWDWRALWGDPKIELNKTLSKWGGFIEDVDVFDHQFFGLLPKVAQTMDPQQRIMLELAWSCLEDAGIPPSRIRGRKVGVLVGVFNHDYKELQERGDASIEAHQSTGTATAVIANRISHFFDFRGPSIPIDTACSSSLNAIHSAIQSLECGDCEMALAGGVNLILTPTRHISFSKMGMLSPTGTCRTFDDSADGYVRGEGAALLLLKPLENAVRDGDRIHGVIKGTAVNHCGETYTLTYPAARAQADAIVTAHERAQVPVGTLNFVELHGTGTPKGDPIEFEGLLQAFSTLAGRQGSVLGKGYCGLSSVKTNIGHLEAAAGVAGVIKVLLAFRHRQLPGFQDFNRINARIALEDSPFHVVDRLSAWTPVDADTPLRAGVSSFGFGGTNAHLILEEAPRVAMPAVSRRKPSKPPCHLVALSAKTPEALLRRMQDLRLWLERDSGAGALSDISRALLLERDHFQHRFACVIDDIEALNTALDAVIAGSDAQGEDADALSVEAASVLMESLKKKKKIAYRHALEQLSSCYREGADLPWEMLFEERLGPNLNLPGYPFARDRSWIPEGLADAGSSSSQASARMHPLLHRNISTLGKQCFASTFKGNEFFLADHVVKGTRVLPGVAYLEMARDAATRTLEMDARTGLSARCRISDVVWMRPMEVGDAPVSVHVDLSMAADVAGRDASVGVLAFRISEAAGHAPVFCRGYVEMPPDVEDTMLDVAAIEQDCADAVHSADVCYRTFDGLGLQYGPGHRALRDLRFGGSQALATIALPAHLGAGQEDFVVHPSTADAALQAAVAFVAGIDAEGEARPHAPSIPFALDSLEINGGFVGEIRAWVRYSPGDANTGAIRKVDIDLIDCIDGQGIGATRMAFRGLSIRPQASELAAHGSIMNGSISKPIVDSISLPVELADALYAPFWIPRDADPAETVFESLLLVGESADVDALECALRASPRFAATGFERLCFGETAVAETVGPLQVRPGEPLDYEAAVAALIARGTKPERIVFVSAQVDAQTAGDESRRLAVGASSVFALAKALFRSVKTARFVHLSPLEPMRPEVLGLSGLYKTLNIEKPSFRGRVVQCDLSAAGALAEIVADELSSADKASDVRYLTGVRQVRAFLPAMSRNLSVQDVAAGDAAEFRESGVYLITGGMGALGLILARHLCGRYRARVYLTGRSAPSDAQTSILAELCAIGGHASYLQCDVAERDDVRRAVATIHADGYRLHGVLHSAGVIEDDFLLRKSAESFARVIAPKTLGSWNLDLETRDEPLDLFVLFSSVTGVLGNVGQCDYGFGNAFEDYFAHQRQQRRSDGDRAGKTVSINWPYWKDGGMRLGDKEEEALRRSFGIVPLLTAQGLDVLEYALRQPRPQIVVMPGDVDRVHEVLGVVSAPRASMPETGVVPDLSVQRQVDARRTVHADDASTWHAPVAHHLTALFASQLGIAPEFETDRSFKDYGFDSVVMIDLIAEMEKFFGTLPKTLFFEYQNLGDLTAYLIEHNADHCRRIAHPEAMHPVASASAVASVEVAVAAPSRTAAYAVRPVAAAGDATHIPGSRRDDDVAIVGLAGRYPKAETLEEFWENLKQGRDCIEEIPQARSDLVEKFRFQSGAATQGKSYGKWGGFLRDVDHFDPAFFNISPKEAENIDPNERLFLEIAALTIEDAGYTPDTIAAANGMRERPVGVYVGVMWGDYQLHGVEGQQDDWVTPHSFYWAIANRVSHQFDFSGPSMVVDTACSSSITAIHLACQAIQRGEIDAAIAGAVNLSLHPNKYNLLSDLHFLSSDGRCRSFGAGGDGYVPGEGVGAVLLKPLSKAREDGDHIYGIVRGSSINHGGKTSGFTVPSPKRQAALVQEALAVAGVDPRHLSYLEAHGTGTSLGDPIEITGLTKAFAQSDCRYCAIGSAKSNVGHLEAAAGIAGLTKVLLQMKHRMLVPSIHSDVINPYIDFEQSPFFVQSTLQPWARPSFAREDASSGSSQRYESPRLAGISSFGAGGSNGHLIVEEHAFETHAATSQCGADGPALIVLSARKSAALKSMATRLADFLENHPETSLQDAAYTLQVGRVGMECRFACLAADASGAIVALRAFGERDAIVGGAWTGHRDNLRRDAAVSLRLADSVAAIPALLAGREFVLLADAWVHGVAVDWKRMHARGARCRVSLPGYPFQRQRYWVSKPERTESVSVLHPLIDANISTLDEQTFSKVLRPEDFFLRDHRLGSNRILPGVASLEMALQAGRLAGGGRQVMALHDVHWHKPVLVNESPLSLRIGLIPERDGVRFDIYREDAQGERIAFSNGLIALEEPDASASSDNFDASLDVQAITNRCVAIERADVDAAFSAMGFAFGASFQVFETLHFNEEEALAHLRLPQIAGTRAGDFALHPALLDGAIRTSLGIGGLVSNASAIRVPTQMRRIDILAPVVGDCFVHARRSAATQAAHAEQQHFDIVLYDGRGQALVRIDRLTIQPAPQLALASRRGMSASLERIRDTATLGAPVAAAILRAAPAALVQAPGMSDQEALQAAAKDYLATLLSSVTKLPIAEIDPDAPLENYGIDSVMIAALNERLGQTFGEVPKTLFFEYQEISGVAGYLVEHHAEHIPRQLSPTRVASPARQAEAADLVASTTTVPAVDLQSVMIRHLVSLVGEVTKLPLADIDPHAALENYGIDSVMIVALNERLGATFGDMPKTLFFEYQDLHGLSEYFLEQHPEQIGALSPDAWQHVGSDMPAATPSPVFAMRETATTLADGIDSIESELPAATRSTARLASRGSPLGRFSALPRDRQARDDIAIIGLSGRYPGARDLHAFWQNLSAGRDSIGEIPATRWDHSRFFHPDRTHKGTVYSKWGGFIDDVDQFDAGFFNISAREAETLDPQERLFLQTAWECVEDACHTRQSLKGVSVGVFVGVMWGNYALLDVSDEQLKSGRPCPPFSSIANRVSYVMNFSGPSMAVDTMCSSSLTAIHLSSLAMQNGDCDLAIAGGVNLILHPNKYQLLAGGQYLSTDGRCRAFGDGGDGYVPGEGVGAVMLKPLHKAIDDGDHVYGVIKATSLNHGGKTNGYTVPNQVAQTNVIDKALDRAGWDPRSIDYIEAHGTGTSLGDPIEIAGLSRAFAAATADAAGSGATADFVPQRCRIGSVKSNVGHLESAAAIAGLTKILLQFRHGAIAPSLHSQTLNTNIDFARTPFRVVQSEERWAAADADTPRRAGLSSFGAGGANAHCLIEAYPRRIQSPAGVVRPALFVLSADSGERLTQYVERIIAFIERGGDPDVGLEMASLAWSSQVGREAMDERIAVVASSATELLAALRGYRAGSPPPHLIRGSLRKNGEKLESIVDDSEKNALIASLILGGRLSQLARAWVTMLDIDWSRHRDALYPAVAGGVPQRMPFPTLPFMTQRHWVEERPANSADALHPLIDRNVSTLSTQAYRKRFDGSEFYLRDHIVHTERDRRILPGVAYLEMARAAGDLAVGPDWRVDRIRNLLWIQPFEISGAADGLTIRMRDADAALGFEIARDSDGAVCVEGELGFREADAPAVDEWLDIGALRADGVLLEPGRDEIYAAFHRMGFHYGPAFQTTRARYRTGQGALTHLRLPGHLRSGLGEYGLHPSLLDAALRTGLAVAAGDDRAPRVPIVPFALGELEFRHPLTEDCYVHAVEARAAAHVSDVGDAAATYRYDIVVTNGDGRVLVKLHGFAGRALVKPSPVNDRALQYFGYEWAPSAIEDIEAGDVAEAQTVWVVGASPAPLATELRSQLPSSDRVVAVALLASSDTAIHAAAIDGSEIDAIDDDLLSGRIDPYSADSVRGMFERMRDRDLLPTRIVYCDVAPEGGERFSDDIDPGRLHQGIQTVRQLFTASESFNPDGHVRLLYAYHSDEPQPQHDAIFGYARSLLTINHRFELSILRCDRFDAEDCARIFAAELAAGAGFGGNEIAYRDGLRLRRSLHAMDLDVADAGGSGNGVSFRDGATYLITGGAGKLGLLIAEYIAGRCRARLVLSGRSTDPSDSLRSAMEALRAQGAEVRYRSADIAVREESEALIAWIVQHYGNLHGVIHCAGVASDRPIMSLDDRAFAEILSPKVDGLIHLDRATADQPLDFFVNFSSVSALLGDLGSGAYAVGNRFMDGHALWRDAQRAQGRRSGRSLSINWPLWATGGMEISGADASVFGFSGMQALTAKEGLEAFDSILRSAQDRVLVSIGDPERVARSLRVGEARRSSAALSPSTNKVSHAASPMESPATARAVASTLETVAAITAVAASGDLQTRVEHYVRQRMAVVTKTRIEAIDAHASFEQCGMDSVLLLELHALLRKDFAELPKTALFEHDSPARMAKFMILSDADAARACVGEVAAAPVESAMPTAAIVPIVRQLPKAAAAKPSLPRSAGFSFKSAAASGRDDDAIAVIGIAGEFPGSPDLAQFWINLRDGKDCLTRIPDDRGFASTLNRKRSRSGRPIPDKGGFIDAVDLFDAKLFRMSQAEADKADPQLRVLLRSAWRAVEDASYTPESLSGTRVGVFVGAMNEDFTWITAELQARAADYIGPGSVSSELSNRLSFLLNFCGPSITVSTACSASLSAVHLARQSILSGDCEMALAGGVNLSLHHSKYQLLHDMKVLSADGHERTFDDAANGLVPSEGAGVVVLKRLSRAIEDGDHIHGIIRGSSISHSGTGAGQFLPNIRVMEDTAARCIREAGLTADDVTYLETHGTGTELGDPIELKALANALRQTTATTGYCAIGTKANIGHMEAASGIGSLIKVMLSMRHGQIAPCAKLRNVNSSFDHAQSPFVFPNESREWPRNARGTRIAAINSFGMGGSNAFLVLESAPSESASARSESVQRTPALFVLSARSEAGLTAYVSAFAGCVRAHIDQGMSADRFADLAYSTQIGRVACNHRLAVVADDARSLLAALVARLDGDARLASGVYAGNSDDRHTVDLLQLIAGDAGNQFVDTLIDARQIDKLATLWVRGARIDWLRLHRNDRRRRMPFPGVPFEWSRSDLRNLLPADADASHPATYEVLANIGFEDAGIVVLGDVIEAIGWHRLAAPSDANVGAGSAIDGDDHLRDYWVDHLGAGADTAVALAQAMSLDAAEPNDVDASEIVRAVHCVSELVDEELVRSLQNFGARHGIALETLITAAWAVLVNRHSKARYSQFGLLGAMPEADVLLPVRIRTVGRQKILEWLSELQSVLLRKHLHAPAPIERISEWVGAAPLFDTVVVFDRFRAAREVGVEDRVPASLLSETHPSSPRPCMELVAAVDGDSLELSLIYRAAEPDYGNASLLLEQFKVLLEGLASNPDKMPSALGMRTKTESRDRFWKTMEAAVD